jgi:hypothetical protein
MIVELRFCLVIVEYEVQSFFVIVGCNVCIITVRVQSLVSLHQSQ